MEQKRKKKNNCWLAISTLVDKLLQAEYCTLLVFPFRMNDISLKIRPSAPFYTESALKKIAVYYDISLKLWLHGFTLMGFSWRPICQCQFQCRRVMCFYLRSLLRCFLFTVRRAQIYQCTVTTNTGLFDEGSDRKSRILVIEYSGLGRGDRK